MHPINSVELMINSVLGGVMRLSARTDRRLFRLGSFEPQIMPAIRLQQIYLAADERGQVYGYAAWAFVSDEVLAELLRDDSRLLHPSEWNEGLNLWIVDFVAPSGHAHKLATALKTVVLSNFDRVRGTRTTAQGAVKRHVDLRRRMPESRRHL